MMVLEATLRWCATAPGWLIAYSMFLFYEWGMKQIITMITFTSTASFPLAQPALHFAHLSVFCVSAVAIRSYFAERNMSHFSLPS